MDLTFLGRGFIFGFTIAAAVGPISLLIIRRTIIEGRGIAFISGLGVASADAVYGSIAGFGLTFISNFLIDHAFWLRLVGGVFLCYLGFSIFYTLPSDKEVTLNTTPSNWHSAYGSLFLLTLTNPLTILSFAAIFAGLGIGSTKGDYSDAGLLVLGVFVGSIAWWTVLTTGVSRVRGWFTPARLRWLNRSSGLIIILFGFTALISLFR